MKQKNTKQCGLLQRRTGHTETEPSGGFITLLALNPSGTNDLHVSVWHQASTILWVPLLKPLSKTRSVACAHFRAFTPSPSITNDVHTSVALLCLSVSVCVRFCFSVSICACPPQSVHTRESMKDTPNVHNRRASRDVHVTSGGSQNRTDRERHLMDFDNACSTLETWRHKRY